MGLGGFGWRHDQVNEVQTNIAYTFRDWLTKITFKAHYQLNLHNLILDSIFPQNKHCNYWCIKHFRHTDYKVSVADDF